MGRLGTPSLVVWLAGCACWARRGTIVSCPWVSTPLSSYSAWLPEPESPFSVLMARQGEKRSERTGCYLSGIGASGYFRAGGAPWSAEQD